VDEPKTMVGQIDVILQRMLEGTTFENQKIHLSEDLRKGVIVWIGLNHYEGIESVPHLEIKQLIRKAVAEWEKRQEKMPRW
jgi:hypothetical protein